MHDLCLKCVRAMNAKHYVSFKRSFLTLPRHIKSFTALHRTHALRIEGSRTVSLYFFFVTWNEATILLLCVMTSNYIPVDMPALEESFNLYFKGIWLTRQKLWPIFHWYVNSTLVLYFFCVFYSVSGVGFPGWLFWFHMIHHSKRQGALNRMTAVSAL